MKMMKSVLAMVMAVCLMMCLAVSAYATEPEATVTATTEENVLLVATEGENAEDISATGEATAPAAADEDTVGVDDESAPAIDFDDLQDAANGETGEAAEETPEEEHDHTHEDETAEEGSGVLRTIVIVLQVIASLALIVVVLVQSGKESGLSGALSGNSDSYMNKSGVGGLDKKLAKATKWVALVWVLLTLVLVLL